MEGHSNINEGEERNNVNEQRSGESEVLIVEVTLAMMADLRNCNVDKNKRFDKQMEYVDKRFDEQKEHFDNRFNEQKKQFSEWFNEQGREINKENNDLEMKLCNHIEVLQVCMNENFEMMKQELILDIGEVKEIANEVMIEMTGMSVQVGSIEHIVVDYQIDEIMLNQDVPNETENITERTIGSGNDARLSKVKNYKLTNMKGYVNGNTIENSYSSEISGIIVREMMEL